MKNIYQQRINYRYMNMRNAGICNGKVKQKISSQDVFIAQYSNTIFN